MSAMSGIHNASPSDDQGSWSGQDYSTVSYGEGSPQDTKDPNMMGLNFLKGFGGGVQKKLTRDGQPAKRRGPKPDSKPAQTRRQELNRQAQRTHRERKEQYIKTLEVELSRLREVYANETRSMTAAFEQHRMLLQQHQQENQILKEMLMAHGIAFENELESRKASANLQQHRPSGSVRPSAVAARPAAFQTVIPAGSPPSGYEPYINGKSGSMGGSMSGHTPHSHSTAPTSPLISEQSIKQEYDPVSDMPGIFEKDPQLGVEFILALEATCRDHGEYLVRRSVDSPNTEEDAQFSGHALMASCPPPSHIANTPPQMGGFQPTYAHQVPDLPAFNLNVLLNLSQRIKAEGYVEGGQVTPIMALQSLRGHRAYTSLTRDDVHSMVEAFRNKIRCYGFGAVMEDFELRDALSSIFATKPETYEGLPEIDDMYS